VSGARGSLTSEGLEIERRILPCPQLQVVSLDSVYGSKRSFDAHLADCGVQRGIPQWLCQPCGRARFRLDMEEHRTGCGFYVAQKLLALAQR